MIVIGLFCLFKYFFSIVIFVMLCLFLYLSLFIQQAGLAKLLGLAGETNVQVSLLWTWGCWLDTELQMKLDLVSRNWKFRFSICLKLALLNFSPIILLQFLLGISIMISNSFSEHQKPDCLISYIQGEEQKKLDVLSNEVFVKALISSGRTVSLMSVP